MWPPVSTVGPHGQLCPTPTCSQGPQAFTSALWQETSPRADSPTGTEIVPARTPTVSRIQHLQQHLESGTAGTSSVFYLVVQLPGLGPPGSPGTQMGGVATAPAVGKGGRKGPLGAQLRFSPLPRPTTSSFWASILSPIPLTIRLPPPSPSSALTHLGPRDHVPGGDRPPTGSRYAGQGCERVEGSGSHDRNRSSPPSGRRLSPPYSFLPDLRQFLLSAPRPALPAGALGAGGQVRGAAVGRCAGVRPCPSPPGTRAGDTASGSRV